MRRWLAKGRHASKSRKPPTNGYLAPLYYKNRGIGSNWHVQVEWVHDTRIKPKPYIICFAWSPSGKEYYLVDNVCKKRNR